MIEAKFHRGPKSGEVVAIEQATPYLLFPCMERIPVKHVEPDDVVLIDGMPPPLPVKRARYKLHLFNYDPFKDKGEAWYIFDGID